MSLEPDVSGCEHTLLISAYALRALPASEASALEVHIRECSRCRDELVSLRAVVDSLHSWSIEAPSPSPSMWDRLVERIDEGPLEAASGCARSLDEPQWEAVAPGISCKILSRNPEKDRVSMLVRLAPGAEYPPHSHAGTEELHLLHGNLWIDERKLYPGDYNRAERGTVDQRVWSESGCTCLLITSQSDILR